MLATTDATIGGVKSTVERSAIDLTAASMIQRKPQRELRDLGLLADDSAAT
jgi:hypothetical protein